MPGCESQLRVCDLPCELICYRSTLQLLTLWMTLSTVPLSVLSRSRSLPNSICAILSACCRVTDTTCSRSAGPSRLSRGNCSGIVSGWKAKRRGHTTLRSASRSSVTTTPGARRVSTPNRRAPNSDLHPLPVTRPTSQRSSRDGFYRRKARKDLCVPAAQLDAAS